MVAMSTGIILQRLVLISLIAGAIGYERERLGRAAGFRTHILVGIGSCLVMLTGLYLTAMGPAGAAVDPTRMASQVISGIGFLGAGTILHSRGSIRGLTTAASLWAVGGVGLAVGAGFLSGAILTGILVIVVLFGFSPLEHGMRKQSNQVLVIESADTTQALVQIRNILGKEDVEIRDIDLKPQNAGRLRIELQVQILPDTPREELLSKLLRLDQIREAHWL